MFFVINGKQRREWLTFAQLFFNSTCMDLQLSNTCTNVHVYLYHNAAGDRYDLVHRARLFQDLIFPVVALSFLRSNYD